MNRLLPLKAVLLLCFIQLPALADPVPSAGDLIKQGDVHDEKFEAAQALKFYLPAEKANAEDVGLLLRIARQYRHMMADAGSLAEKLKYGGLGISYAGRAAALAPQDSEAFLSIAISHAKMAPLLGNKEKMEASRQVKLAVDKTLALDPRKDLAWHLLGCWHQRLAEIGGFKRAMASMIYGSFPAASNEESVQCFQKAIALNPSRLIHYIEMGRTYAQMGQEKEARQFIQKGLGMQSIGKDDPETKKRGRETLADL